MNKGELEELLKTEFLKREGIIDLSNLNLEGYSVDLSGLRASIINNRKQEANVIFNGNQTASSSISNSWQKANFIIDNSNQSSNKINIKKIKYEKITT